MFEKILVANRGEIALRVIRACRELGIRSVAVYSEVDADSLHTSFADEAVCIGPAQSAQSYLSIPAIISAAEITGADAIHPGYGFLAESAHFSEVCEECKIQFIGPTPATIRLMGDKSEAKKTMRKAGVPVIPGSEEIVATVEDAKKIARKYKYPVIIKASAGGGGRGMRVVNEESEMENAFHTASTEAGNAFSNPALYLEKYLQNPKHIEFQILGDYHGTIIHLGERDCSVQRRHQKLIEESPCPIMDKKLRERMGSVAVKAAKAAHYFGAGTVEFLLSGKDFFFMEMNTRIQVEHPVTEVVTDVDLVKEQILIAAGERISVGKHNIEISGHSIECRINAEDPDNGFIPNPGRITSFHQPGGPGIRVDSHVYQDYVISPYYDSMIAKLIVRGRTRSEAIARMVRALDEFVIEGVKTTIPFHRIVLTSEKFKRGDFGTSFVDEMMSEDKE